ncbi:MAG: hypothetical protein KIT14_10135 [bacterium]|nr:hypothetical protein [bacterium]
MRAPRLPAPLGALLGLAATVAGAAAQGPPLDRDLGAFCLFAMRSLNLKNLTLNSACNVGVNCARPTTNSDCGTVNLQRGFLADGAQLASDAARIDGGSLWQLFRNDASSLAGVTLRRPGPKPDGTFPLSPLPILADADGDGAASCAPGCVPDYGDVEVACGFPAPFPACTAGADVTVPARGDCTGAADASPGNGRCDLAPGSYGRLTVQNGAALTLRGGTYALCQLNLGRNTTTRTDDPAVLAVSGDVAIGNGSTFGLVCGAVTLFARGPGGFSLGRNTTVVGEFCAPERALLVGRGSDLTGRLVGDRIPADFDVRVSACGGVGPAEVCACFDAFAPTTAPVGATVIFTGGCDLRAVDAVTICGRPAGITLRAQNELHVVVPVGANGACPVRAVSTAGAFTAATPLVVP